MVKGSGGATGGSRFKFQGEQKERLFKRERR